MVLGAFGSQIRIKKIKIAVTAAPNIQRKKSIVKKMEELKEDGIAGLAKKFNENNGLFLEPGLKDDRQVFCEYKEELCIICFDQKPNSLYKQCNHGGLCKDCSIEIFNSHKKCPLCRANIEYVIIFEEREGGRLYEIDKYYGEGGDSVSNDIVLA